MTGFSDSLGDSAEYTYYSDGLRSSRKIGGSTFKYYYNGDKVINETKNGSNFATNVYGVDGPISRQYSGLEHYYYKNVHGDVIFAFTSNHWRSSEYSYAAYGEEDTSYDYYSSNPNPLRYSGEYFDTESGMTYLRARYYDPYRRRFISEDPAEDGLNWYAYCGNNPVMFVDPSGYLRTGYDEDGNWHDWDAEEFGYDSDTYKIIEAATQIYNNAQTDEVRATANYTAELARNLARQGTPLKYGQVTLMNQLHENADLALEREQQRKDLIKIGVHETGTYEWFVEMECGEWDYKYNDNLRVPYPYFQGINMNEIKGDGSMPKNWTGWIFFDGMVISADQFSNINLGYVGKRLGYDGFLLLNATTTGGGDDYWISYGINMANIGR